MFAKFQIRAKLSLLFLFFLQFLYFENTSSQIIIPKKDFQICPNSIAYVSATIGSSAPAFVQLYHEESRITTTYSSQSAYSFQIALNTPGTYRVTNYGSPGDTIVDNNTTITISYLSNLSISLDGGGNFCNSLSPTPIKATFTGTAPFTFKFLINNIPDSIKTSNSTFTFGTNQNIQVLSVQVSDQYCVLSDTQSATFNSVIIPTPEIEGDTFSCLGSNGIFNSEINSYDYNWKIPSNVKFIGGSTGKEPSITVEWPETGEYVISLQLKDILNNCASEWGTLVAKVNKPPQVSVNIDTSVCLNPDIPFVVTIPTNDGETIYWPSQNYTGSTKNIYSEGTYAYYLIDENQCSDTGYVSVTSICPATFFVPEAFTPNGDNINDNFEIFGTYVKLEFKIYSPTGQLLFTMQQEQPFWDGTRDGKDLPNGVYYWYAKYTDSSMLDHTLNGTVTLIR